MIDIIKPHTAIPAGVVAFFTTRNGGVSDPPYHSLNLSLHVGDEPLAVEENRLRLAEMLPQIPRFLRQAHSNRVMVAEQVRADADVADAVQTRSTGIVCAVQTADCLPVLLYHADGGGVGAAHAGWRGIAAGVLQNTVAAMRAQSDSPLSAYIGPGIGVENYIVGDDFRRFFNREEDAQAFQHANGTWRADLVALARHRLLTAGVTAVFHHGGCTFGGNNVFYSARRDKTTGRQAAVIYIRPPNNA